MGITMRGRRHRLRFRLLLRRCGRRPGCRSHEAYGEETGTDHRSWRKEQQHACGPLRVMCEGEPAKVSLCHCLECQRRTGSTFGIAAFFSRDAIQTEGNFRSYWRKADSGFAVHFQFCPVCGSTVFWEPERKPDAVAVAVGCFADPMFPAPSQSVYNQRRHAWVPPLE